MRGTLDSLARTTYLIGSVANWITLLVGRTNPKALEVAYSAPCPLAKPFKIDEPLHKPRHTPAKHNIELRTTATGLPKPTAPPLQHFYFLSTLPIRLQSIPNGLGNPSRWDRFPSPTNRLRSAIARSDTRTLQWWSRTWWKQGFVQQSRRKRWK